jgi:hypothetical protein
LFLAEPRFEAAQGGENESGEQRPHHGDDIVACSAGHPSGVWLAAARNATPAVTASMTRMGSALVEPGMNLESEDGEDGERGEHVGPEARQSVAPLALEADHAAQARRQNEAQGDDQLRKARADAVEHRRHLVDFSG